MKKIKTVYFSELLHTKHKAIFMELSSIITSHGYNVKTLIHTKDIWIRDFMPIVTNDGLLQYQYTPDYLADRYGDKIRSNPIESIQELGLETKSIDLILDGGNMVMCDDTIIMTDKVYIENPSLNNDKKILESIFYMYKKVIVIPWDKNEPYGHADGMVRFISENHLLVNSQYPKSFKDKLQTRLIESGFKYTELKMKEDTKYAWGYINFLHLDNLIIQPSINKVNDSYVKSQLEELYPNTTIKLCDTRALVKKGGVLNCISWEL